MPTLEITADNFIETIQKNELVLFDWWAPWCGPCRVFAPIYEAAAGRHPGVVFGKVNTETERQLAATFEIRAIPTLMVFRDGILLFTQPGLLPGEALDRLIAEVRSLDMDEIRKEAEAAADASPSRIAEGTG